MAKAITKFNEINWWVHEDKRLADMVMQRARDITTRSQFRRHDDELHLRYYSVNEWRGVYGIDRRRINYSPSSYKSSTPGGSGNNRRLSLNVIRSCVNAATSMIVRSRPYVSFMTDGADYPLLCVSKKRERFVQAHFQRDKIHELGQRRVRNACIFGTGGTKVLKVGKQITYENILPGEILVDEQESIDGNPPCIYQAKLIDKVRLIAKFPKFKDKIMGASGSGGYWGSDNAAQALVVFAWHFPNEEDKSDGFEAMCIDGATIYKRPYRWSKFPGCFFRWEEDPFGFFGSGLPAELSGIQYEINALLRMIQESVYYGGNLKLFVMKGSKVQLAHFSNSTKIPVIEYTGAQPRIEANDVASPQMFSHLNWLEQKAYNITGVSQLDAQSQTPFASQSGRARLVQQNSDSLRFKHTTERYENNYPDLAEATLQAATDLSDGFMGTEDEIDEIVIFRGREHLEQISYSDVAIKEDETHLDIEAWSSSQLAHTPGARMSQVDFLLSNGYIDKRRALSMMELGDVRSETDLANAPFDLVDERIARILYEGEMDPPSPYMDLDYSLGRVQLEIQRCELRSKVPADRLDMLREFREQIVDLQIKATPPPPPPPPAAALPSGAELPPPGNLAPLEGAEGLGEMAHVKIHPGLPGLQ
jgi:hypothetical protein